jgi:hypothetical protein
MRRIVMIVRSGGRGTVGRSCTDLSRARGWVPPMGLTVGMEPGTSASNTVTLLAQQAAGYVGGESGFRLRNIVANKCVRPVPRRRVPCAKHNSSARAVR